MNDLLEQLHQIRGLIVEDLRKPKDRWDKIGILGSISVPLIAAIIAGGFALYLEEQRLVREQERQERQDILDSKKEVADRFEEAKFARQLIKPLTGKASSSEKKAAMALLELYVSDDEVRRRLLVATNNQKEVTKTKRLPNGKACNSKKECQSCYCYPGPEEGNFCLAASLNCAFPGSNGVRYGSIVSLDEKTFKCINPRDGGKARYVELK